MADKPLLDKGQEGQGNKLMDEVKAGGIKGILGIDQLDWGEGKGGKIWECWKCEPCCGEPCSFGGCIQCWIHFHMLGFFTYTQWFAREVGQDCAIWPHCCLMCCCNICSRSALRYNLRKKAGQQGTIVGDFCCMWCCGPCASCQEMRSVPVDRWKWMDFTPLITTGPIKMIN